MATQAAWSAVDSETAPVLASAGIQTYHAQTRKWGGIRLRTTQLAAAEGMCIQSPYTEQARIIGVLEEIGGRVQCRNMPRVSSAAAHAPGGTSCGSKFGLAFLPAGYSAWACSEQSISLRLAALSFDVDELVTQLGQELDRTKLQVPVLALSDERIWQLLRNLVAECHEPDVFSGLYCDSLVVALMIEILRLDVGQRGRNKFGALSRRQLQRAIDCIEAGLTERITLSDLAERAGMSASHFCRAFRISTGMPPHRWQLNARIRRAQQLLLADTPIAAAAAVTGFADQSHFTRVFRRQVGETPASWRRRAR